MPARPRCKTPPCPGWSLLFEWYFCHHLSSMSILRAAHAGLRAFFEGGSSPPPTVGPSSRVWKLYEAGGVSCSTGDTCCACFAWYQRRFEDVVAHPLPSSTKHFFLAYCRRIDLAAWRSPSRISGAAAKRPALRKSPQHGAARKRQRSPDYDTPPKRARVHASSHPTLSTAASPPGN